MMFLFKSVFQTSKASLQSRCFVFIGSVFSESTEISTGVSLSKFSIEKGLRGSQKLGIRS